ncbi:hypothetical protein CCACVL1_06789 [Corchorus capsularis]|uniref:Uncharacterized protein n=1 Tax=Corchorus capsularis TaxID=210143 RepID=A0A1R3JCV3_COCAP|nr:hypothetical protein CCACVL1_06789 [Corchorus capsularis]
MGVKFKLWATVERDDGVVVPNVFFSGAGDSSVQCS